MPNALAHEKSPYLRQHADNPVDWLPWGEAAFARARAEDKPIFLSIGYSTCHWCHVMAHESFENAAIAAQLNADFVAIKVDREERPDVDRVYMAYVQAATGHGGWPLSAWLTPELKPFFGGTYFPPEDRPGRPGFPSLLRAIAHGWKSDRAKLVAESERVIGVLKQHADETSKLQTPSSQTDEVPLAVAGGEAFEKCFQHLYENFDAAHGGFGGAPKFPRAANLNFLFRCAAIQGATSELGAEAIRMAAATLRAMARGGIHDHVGGGFHRYAVDEGWFVPHFEKMLYDQAQIALNALEAKQATGDERFAWLARDIFDCVQRELTHARGGFFSAEDADSLVGHGRPEHAEGAFYVWTKAEIVAALDGGAVPSPRGEGVPMRGEGAAPPDSEAEFFCAHFGVEENGNVPAHLDPQGELRGKNVLAQRRTLAESAKSFSLTPEQANARLLAALAKLRAVRAGRPRPHLDDKIVTAWNGLMISAFARGAVIAAGAGDPGYMQAAVRAAEFVERELWDASRGVLFRAWREGRGAAEGFAEDYAFFVQGLLDLYEATFDARWLAWAVKLQAKMDELFWDPSTGAGQASPGRGGYFNSAAGDPHLVLRLKEDYDGAEPAPSSVAALNLLRLGAIFHDDGGAVPSPRGENVAKRGEGTAPPAIQPAATKLSYRERGVRCIEAFRAQWARAPHALPQMLCALELALEPPRHVVLAGEPDAADFRALAAVLHEGIGPRRTILRAGAAVPWTAAMTPVDGRAAAYVCEDYACQLPVTGPAELRRLLSWHSGSA